MNWEEIEKYSGIKIKLEDGGFRPVNEWLDDLYLKCNVLEIYDLIDLIMNNADSLFGNITTHTK